MTQKPETTISGPPRLRGLMRGVAAIAPAMTLGFGMGSATAQELDVPPELFFTISTGLEYEDRKDFDSVLEVNTSVGVGYFTSTSDQRLSFQSGVTARGSEEDGFELIDPFLNLSYARFTRNIEVSGDLTYSRNEIDVDDLDDDFDTEDLERDEGTREDIGFGVRLVTGRASPFGTDTELRYAEENFTDGATDDDTETRTARTTLRFTLDPRIVLTLTGFWEEEQTEDLVRTVDTTRRVTAGANLAIDRLWSADVGLGYAEVETETIFNTTVEDGVEGFLVLTRDMGNGTLSFSTDHTVTDDGWRNSVRVGRVLNFANGDVLSASIGQVFFEEGDSGHLASLTFDRVVRSGSLSVGFDYAADLDDDDQLVQRTQLNASLRQNLTDYSGWSLDGALASVAYDNPATADAVRVDVGIAYLHALSNDWDFAARLEHQVLYEDGAVDDRINTLSLNFERRFSVRP